MGFHLKFIWEWNRTISYYVIIALIAGAGAGYMVGNSPVSSLMEEREQLVAMNDSLYLAFQDLEAELNSSQVLLDAERMSTDIFVTKYINQLQEFIDLQSEMSIVQDDYRYVEDKYEELLIEKEYLNRSYFDLQNTLNLYGMNNYSRELIFILNASHSGYDERTVTFDVGYGILMDVFVSLSKSAYESNIDIELSWRRDNRSGFLVGLGNAHAEGYDVVTVRAFCEIFDEKSDQIWVKSGAQIEELSWIEKSRLTAFSVP